MTSRERTRKMLAIGLASALRELVRKRLNLVLILVLPPLVVRGYGSAMESFPDMPFMETLPKNIGLINGAMATVAILSGIIGLFQVLSARQADGRLSLCGFSQGVLFATRLATVGLVAAVAAALSLGAAALDVTPDLPVLAYVVLVMTGLLYGLVGMLIGTVLPRELEGSLVLVFLADLDEAVSSGVVDIDATVTNLLPLHYPHRLFEAAFHGTDIDPETWVFAVSYLVVLGAVALVVHTKMTENGGANS